MRTPSRSYPGGKVHDVVAVSFRVPASETWVCPSLELGAAGTWPVIVRDCDGTNGYSRLMLAVLDKHIPCPNWVVHRDTGGAHGVWRLERPVHQGVSSRAKPLRLLGWVTEYLAQKVEVDAGYTGVLTHNPTVPDPAQKLETDRIHKDPYPLSKLAKIIPFGWRKPIVPTSGVGRNVSLFEAGMRWAGSPAKLELPVFVALMAVNAEVAKKHGKPPLDPSEVAGIAKSVELYRERWIDQGKFYFEAERFAWGRENGIRSGRSRQKGPRLNTIESHGKQREFPAATLGPHSSSEYRPYPQSWWPALRKDGASLTLLQRLPILGVTLAAVSKPPLGPGASDPVHRSSHRSDAVAE